MRPIFLKARPPKDACRSTPWSQERGTPECNHGQFGGLPQSIKGLLGLTGREAMSDENGNMRDSLRRGLSRRQFIESGAALATLSPTIGGLLAAVVPQVSQAAANKVLVIVQQPGSLRTVDPGRASEVDGSAITR